MSPHREEIEKRDCEIARLKKERDEHILKSLSEISALNVTIEELRKNIEFIRQRDCMCSLEIIDRLTKENYGLHVKCDELKDEIVMMERAIKIKSGEEK